MEKNTVILRDTDVFMRGELDNVTISDGRIVLDLVQGGYVPYGCYTSAPIPMPLFDALRVSWNAASPDGTAVEAQCRVLVDGNWTAWMAFGKWSLYLQRAGAAPRERGPLQLTPDCLLLDSKCATQVQLRIYLYSKNEKATPAVHLLGATVRMVDVIPSSGGKGVGVEKILAHYGLDKSQAIAFGDGNNDIEMLQAVGTGVAMGNGSAQLKAVAGAVCPKVTEDGIYRYCLENGLI